MNLFAVYYRPGGQDWAPMAVAVWASEAQFAVAKVLAAFHAIDRTVTDQELVPVDMGPVPRELAVLQGGKLTVFGLYSEVTSVNVFHPWLKWLADLPPDVIFGAVNTYRSVLETQQASGREPEEARGQADRAFRDYLATVMRRG